MSGTYKVVEIVGTSSASFAEAVKSAVEEASKTIRHLDWFEVIEQRGRIVEGKVQEFQVSLKVGFKVEK
jgi:dodecin